MIKMLFMSFMIAYNVFGAPLDKIPSQKHYDAIVEHVRNGQYTLAKNVAENWAAEPDIDKKYMAQRLQRKQMQTNYMRLDGVDT